MGDEAEDVVARLGLEPHPEGGFYRETYRHRPPDGGRAAVAHIYYLLPAGHRSVWHRVDVTEIWHLYAGAPLRLTLSSGRMKVRHIILGSRIGLGERPHFVVEPWTWMTAVSLGGWTLVGCTTAPAFTFEGFELAPPDWQPGSPADEPGGRHHDINRRGKGR